MDIDDVITWMNDEHEDATGRPYAASTLVNTRNRLRTAMAALGTDEPSVLADTLTSTQSTKALFATLKKTNARSSQRQVYGALLHLHAYALDTGAITGSFDYPAPKRGPREPVQVYSQDDVAKVVESARGRSLRWFAFVATTAHTGRRVGELLGLEWSMLHREGADDVYFDLLHTKAGRQQHVPLDSFLRDQVFTEANVAALKSDTRGRFTRDPAVCIFPWQYNTAQKMLRRHCEVIGVDYRGFHRFRHTFATHWMPKLGLVPVSRLLGHARVETTASIYDHTTGRDYGPLLG